MFSGIKSRLRRYKATGFITNRRLKATEAIMNKIANDIYEMAKEDIKDKSVKRFMKMIKSIAKEKPANLKHFQNFYASHMKKKK